MLTRRLAMLAAVLAITGCGLENQGAPPLSGPSELGLSLNVSATPDIIKQDGQSQAKIEILARDASNQLVRGLTMHVETLVQTASGLTAVDFGTLSSKTVSTGNDGRASLVYVAPPEPPASAGDDTTVVIAVTPVGSNYTEALPRTVQLRLTRPGVILPPNGTPVADFFFSPSAPREDDSIRFDASGSKDDGTIVSYTWNFGDGGTGSGVRVNHAYSLTGTYTVLLPVPDDRGMTATATKDVSVGTVTGPTAAFTFSPSTPIVNQSVNFNGTTSTASNGHHITSYDWDFGDGTSHGSGSAPTHAFAIEGTYTITLLVTDDTGRTGVVTKDIDIAVAAPHAEFTFSPQTIHAATTVVTFSTTLSTAPAGRTITAYSWNFNDGGSSTASTPTHTFAATGSYTVVLMVTDSAGATNVTSKIVTVVP